MRYFVGPLTATTPPVALRIVLICVVTVGGIGRRPPASVGF